MSGKKRREMRDIFARFEQSEAARFAHEASELRKKIAALANEIEELLGLDHQEIEGQTRTELMIFINGLLERIQELDAVCNSFEAENEQLREALAASEERERLMKELLDLYKQLQSDQIIERQDLLRKIDELTKQIDELSKKPEPRRKPSSDNVEGRAEKEG